MQCPNCQHTDSRVLESRSSENGQSIRRRRECLQCKYRFTTYERREHAIVVRKRDGSAEPFSPAKVLAGISNALADRRVPSARLDAIVQHDAKARSAAFDELSRGIGELSSRNIGCRLGNAGLSVTFTKPRQLLISR